MRPKLNVFKARMACAVALGIGSSFSLVAAAVGRAASAAGALPSLGALEVAGNVARFIRPGLTEEYRVGVDGVQQDFIINQRPGGQARLPDSQGLLRVDLAVAGAKAEPLADGVRHVRYPKLVRAAERENLLSHGAR